MHFAGITRWLKRSMRLSKNAQLSWSAIIFSCHTTCCKRGKRRLYIQTSIPFPYAINSKCQVILSILARSINIKVDATHCTFQIDFTLMNVRLSDWSVLPNTLIQSEVILDSFKIAFNVFFCPVIPLINGQWKIESTLQHVKAKHEGCQKISIKTCSMCHFPEIL